MYKLSKAELAERAARRGRYPEHSCWYAVMTHGGQEMRVAERIGQELGPVGVEEVQVPVYQGPESGDVADGRGTLLFGSYVFVRCVMTDDIYEGICAGREVFRILGEAWRIPQPIEAQEMDRLKAILSAFRKPEVVRAIEVGREVEVATGLMQGLRGRVVECNATHVKLQTTFSFLEPGTSVRVVVPRSALRIDAALLVERATGQ